MMTMMMASYADEKKIEKSSMQWVPCHFWLLRDIHVDIFVGYNNKNW